MPSNVEFDDDTSDSLSVIKKYLLHETMAAVSVLKDFTTDRGLDDILHSMFNIEDKLQDSHVKIKFAVNKPPSIHFSNCSKMVCDINFDRICFY